MPDLDNITKLRSESMSQTWYECEITLGAALRVLTIGQGFAIIAQVYRRFINNVGQHMPASFDWVTQLVEELPFYTKTLHVTNMIPNYGELYNVHYIDTFVTGLRLLFIAIQRMDTPEIFYNLIAEAIACTLYAQNNFYWTKDHREEAKIWSKMVSQPDAFSEQEMLNMQKKVKKYSDYGNYLVSLWLKVADDIDFVHTNSVV